MSTKSNLTIVWSLSKVKTRWQEGDLPHARGALEPIFHLQEAYEPCQICGHKGSSAVLPHLGITQYLILQFRYLHETIMSWNVSDPWTKASILGSWALTDWAGIWQSWQISCDCLSNPATLQPIPEEKQVFGSTQLPAWAKAMHLLSAVLVLVWYTGPFLFQASDQSWKLWIHLTYHFWQWALESMNLSQDGVYEINSL